jgi:predicted TIM-barrel fold metal-dependent hydrolase
MALIDFHLHFFSRPYFEALASESTQPGTPQERLERAAAKARIELPTADLAQHTGRWMAELERSDVEHACAFASHPQEIAALAEARTLAKGRITPFALVNPRQEGCAERVRSLMREKGFGGVLLFPAMHHYDVSGAECAPLFDVLDELGGVAYVHCGLLVVKLRDLLGLPRTVNLYFANPIGVIPAANAHPRARFVIPHFGAGCFRETLMAGAQCPNVYVDSSSSNGWIATQPEKLSLKDVFERALGVFGPERILFGTDSGTFPAGWRRDRFEEQRACLAALSLSAQDQEKIFAGNARRLLARPV